MWKGLQIMNMLDIKYTIIIEHSKLIISQMNKKEKISKLKCISWSHVYKEVDHLKKNVFTLF